MLCLLYFKWFFRPCLEGKTFWTEMFPCEILCSRLVFVLCARLLSLIVIQSEVSLERTAQSRLWFPLGMSADRWLGDGHKYRLTALFTFPASSASNSHLLFSFPLSSKISKIFQLSLFTPYSSSLTQCSTDIILHYSPLQVGIYNSYGLDDS